MTARPPPNQALHANRTAALLWARSLVAMQAQKLVAGVIARQDWHGSHVCAVGQLEQICTRHHVCTNVALRRRWLRLRVAGSDATIARN